MTTPNVIIGGSIINTAMKQLNGIAPEMHLFGHNFTGPFTNLKKRLNPDGSWKEWSKPINRIDFASYHHDLKYEENSDIASRLRADKEMLEEMDNIRNPTIRERMERKLVKKIIGKKLQMGAGVNIPYDPLDSTRSPHFHIDLPNGEVYHRMVRK